MFPKDHVRLFKNPVVEFFTYIPWFQPLLMFLPLGVYLTHYQVTTYHTSGGGIVWQLIGGFLMWTLMEYGLHRYIFHMSTDTKVKKFLQFYSHGIHHDHPSEIYRLVAPPLMSLPLAVGVFCVFYLIFPATIMYGLFTGVLLGYLYYEWCHYSSHHRKVFTAWGKFLRKYHMVHHFKDHHALYGVSSPIWDIVFGTYKKV